MYTTRRMHLQIGTEIKKMVPDATPLLRKSHVQIVMWYNGPR